MLEIGDVYAQTFTVTDSTGTATDATSTSCVITLPDSTTVTNPTVTINHMGTGKYQVVYTTTQSGLHTVAFTGFLTTYSFTQGDSFNVATSPPGFLVSLADAKATLNITSTTNDEEVRTFLAAATDVVEQYCGSIVQKAYTEVYDGGTTSIALWHTPVVSVSSIQEYYGSTYVRTLNVTDIFGGTGTDPFGYTIELASGVITRRAAGVAVCFASGYRNVQVAYTAGRSVVPASLQEATRIILQHLWSTRRGGAVSNAVSGFGADDVSTTPGYGYAVPNAALQLMSRYLSVPGIG